MRVETTDRKGMLSSVTSIIANQGINIKSASAKTTKEKTGLLDFVIEVSNLSVLNELLRSIQRLTGVTKAYRVDKKETKAKKPKNGKSEKKQRKQ